MTAAPNRLTTGVFILGLAVIVVLLVYASRTNQNRTSIDVAHPSEYEVRMEATKEGPPVIVLAELEKRGLDSTTAEVIEPHFHVLNAALVTLVELQEDYDAATLKQQRALNAQAVPFHLTADRHQREILALLPMPQETIFDNYVEERKLISGLRDWHTQHTEENSPGGLVRPSPRRHIP